MIKHPIKDFQPLTTYILADSHIGHEEIIEYTNRPFQTVESMDNYIINAWKKTVKPSSPLIHLGDVLLASTPLETEERLRSIIPQLPGYPKILVSGNHDLSREKMLSVGFDEVYDFLFLNHLGFNIGLAHKPNNTQLQKHIKRGNIGLHGHIHQHPSPLDNLINMSVELWGYEPIEVSEVLEHFTI